MRHGKESHRISSNCRCRPARPIPSPPIGPALGQRGLNIMEFCKAFNAQTQKMEKGAPIPVVITIYGDRSFTFEMKTPPVSLLPQEGGQARERLEDPGPRHRRLRDQGQVARSPSRR